MKFEYTEMREDGPFQYEVVVTFEYGFDDLTVDVKVEYFTRDSVARAGEEVELDSDLIPTSALAEFRDELQSRQSHLTALSNDVHYNIAGGLPNE